MPPPPPTSGGPLTSLYRELLLEHGRNPRNRGTMDRCTAEGHARNLACGDEVSLQLLVEGGTLTELRFVGEGCAISQAAASLLTTRLQGESLEEARRVSARFTEMLRGDAEAAADPMLGDLRALAGVADFPGRVSCALLAFDALRMAVDRVPESGSPPSPHPGGS